MLPLYTYLHETSHAVSPWVEYGPYGLWGQKVKGQGHKVNARITENGFLRITASPLHLSSWNFTCSLPMSRVWTLWTLGSKGQRSRSQYKDYWKRILAHKCFPFTRILMKLHMQSPHESSMDPMDFEVKGQGHNARITENGFLPITASPLHLSLWTFTCSLPMSQVCALWNLGSKGQRSRSQCKDYWKWFLAHNCFPFTPIFMKLHMQSPHESSMDPMDFGVKRSKVKVTMQGLLRKVSGA